MKAWEWWRKFTKAFVQIIRVDIACIKYAYELVNIGQPCLKTMSSLPSHARLINSMCHSSIFLQGHYTLSLHVGPSRCGGSILSTLSALSLLKDTSLSLLVLSISWNGSKPSLPSNKLENVSIVHQGVHYL